MANRQPGVHSPLSPEDIVVENQKFEDGKGRRIAYDPKGDPLIDVELWNREYGSNLLNGYVRMDSEPNLVEVSETDQKYFPDLRGGYLIMEYSCNTLETGDRNIYVLENLETNESYINFREETPDLVKLSETVSSYLEGFYPVDVMGESREGENLEEWERLTWENIILRTLKGD